MSKRTSIFRIRWKAAILIPAILLVGLSTGCRVEQEEAGELPDVDVDVDAGELPEYEVEGPEVDVGSEEQEVTVPDVDVSTEEKTIEVPTVDIEPPTDDGE